ncbi:MAG: DNA repair protein RadC [Bacteroidales bacterium]|nr:DNA repair protein RadC [Bacteroidales bacterium]
MKILDLFSEERPREKMKSHGAPALSNGELLAVLFRSGREGESALEMAQRLLGRVEGSLSRLFALSFQELCSVPGIGSGKACTLLAACELARRFMLEGVQADKRPVTCARMVYDLMLPRLKGLDHEEFWVVYLNASWYYLGCDRVTSGSGNSTTFDVRRVVKGALDRGAFAVAVVHNHPSGNPNPSRADIVHTTELREACDRFDLSLLDHVVVSDDSFYSFHEDHRYER